MPRNSSKDNGLRFLLQGNLKQAEFELCKATKTHPEDIEAWNALGTVLELQNRLDEAIKIYREGLLKTVQNPSLVEIHDVIVKHLNKREAVVYWKGHMFRPSKNKDVLLYWMKIANILRNNNQLDFSIKALKKALFIEPDNVERWELLGDLSDKLGRRKEAVKAYKRVIELEFNIIIGKDINIDEEIDPRVILHGLRREYQTGPSASIERVIGEIRASERRILSGQRTTDQKIDSGFEEILLRVDQLDETLEKLGLRNELGKEIIEGIKRIDRRVDENTKLIKKAAEQVIRASESLLKSLDYQENLINQLSETLLELLQKIGKPKSTMDRVKEGLKKAAESGLKEVAKFVLRELAKILAASIP